MPLCYQDKYYLLGCLHCARKTNLIAACAMRFKFKVPKEVVKMCVPKVTHGHYLLHWLEHRSPNKFVLFVVTENSPSIMYSFFCGHGAELLFSKQKNKVIVHHENTIDVRFILNNIYSPTRFSQIHSEPADYRLHVYAFSRTKFKPPPGSWWKEHVDVFYE